jgi:hypothetical protein
MALLILATLVTLLFIQLFVHTLLVGRHDKRIIRTRDMMVEDFWFSFVVSLVVTYIIYSPLYFRN